ncbi:sigma-70 family RNA polymerase sigma factor [Streptomyces swartbergensis]|uniref:RNA polymerase sigma factor 70 region 4 type 2 domain-containing protein n=1 Tax=Streptomyces swartbergensis TaxID=487165 RepID=A0A243RA31_9ACTN|nr:sigma-70 family RNA polymerase sigma factor [Streptomyces swartbergensis]OUC91499.1 hypothetical protein CA983_39530 [Streptomyces swartbergensis]
MAKAWATLKQEVAVRLEIQSRSLALVDTAAFARVRQETRARLETLESSPGLYAAIARLPERHYDVIVLHYVLGIPQRRIARLMGIDCGTVRSHLRGARRRPARELGIVWSTDEEE